MPPSDESSPFLRCDGEVSESSSESDSSGTACPVYTCLIFRPEWIWGCYSGSEGQHHRVTVCHFDQQKLNLIRAAVTLQKARQVYVHAVELIVCSSSFQNPQRNEFPGAVKPASSLFRVSWKSSCNDPKAWFIWEVSPPRVFVGTAEWISMPMLSMKSDTLCWGSRWLGGTKNLCQNMAWGEDTLVKHVL